ncbi:MAG: hypothetical protein IPK33_23465 [Gemmatimonadetes bacterium]|nr:hypothetical protein [Gemmatimonadota bacterium]
MNAVDAIRQHRTSGRVSCVLLPHAGAASATDLADLAVQSVGLRALGDAWLEISESDAESIATGILHRDLAYHTEIMALALAAEAGERAVVTVPQPLTCFTNGDWAEAFSGELGSLDSVGFDPISDAALDAGIICVGDGVTALL